jgi:hypothetical protein
VSADDLKHLSEHHRARVLFADSALADFLAGLEIQFAGVCTTVAIWFARLAMKLADHALRHR